MVIFNVNKNVENEMYEFLNYLVFKILKKKILTNDYLPYN